MVKPAQTGCGGGRARRPRRCHPAFRRDATTFEFGRFPDPLSPAAAARVSGLPPVSLAEVAARVGELARTHRLVVVEGAGGLLVRFDEDGATIADLAHTLRAPVLVVARAGLGTLNHTALTLEALAGRGLDLAGVVIGSWPDEPGLAERCNVTDLETLAARPLAGALPEGAGALGRADFARVARAGLGPRSAAGSTLPGSRATLSL